MKFVWISVLLFFDLCSGYSVNKIQRKRSAESDLNPGQMDVYEVNEGAANTVKLTHPKPEKPTLREIIYYHLIEYPYENQSGIKKENSTVDEGSDVNGDGTPEEYDDELPQGKEDEEGDEQANLEGQEQTEEVQTSEDSDQAKFKLDVRTRNGQPITSENIKEYDQNNIVPFDKKKNSRNVLFDEARTKYVVRRQKKSASRRKREIAYKDLPPKPVLIRKREISFKDLPSAPTLPPLNLGALPEYIRRLITPESEPKTTLKDQLTHLNEEDFSKEVENKLEAMISSLKLDDDEDETKTDEDDDDDDDDSDDNSEELEEENEDDSENQDVSNNDYVENKNTTPKRIPKTFGMNLTMGRGYMWNDLLSEPGLSFDIGESVNDSENTRDEVTQQPETTKKPGESMASAKPEEVKKPNANELSIPFEPFTNVLHPTESRPINNEDSSNDKNTDNEDISDKPDKDLEDIDINNFKTKQLPETENSEEKQDDRREHKDDKESETITTDVTKNKDHDANEHELKPNKENNSHHTPNHKKNKHKHKAIFKPENDDSLMELMKNKEFWKWLSDWTSAYMELLMKHIKEMVHDEVSRQMKAFALNLKKNTPLEVKNEKDTEEKEEKGNTHKTSSEHTKDDTNPFIHNDNQLIANKNENSTPDNNTFKHDDNILITDEKINEKMIPTPEDNLLLLPFTHNTNFNLNNRQNEINYNKNFAEEESNDLADFLRNKKHKTDNENGKKPNAINKRKQDKSSIRISATNIFGNAPGSDKVTNIFVFYPSNDEDGANILSNITPSMSGVNNIFVSGKPDKINIDERLPEISKQNDEITATDKDSNNSTAQLNEDMAERPSDLLKKNKEDQEPQTEPSTTTSKENIEKIQKPSEKIEQGSNDTVKEQNTSDKPKVEDIGKDDGIKTTTESANTETTTIPSSDKKDQEDIKSLESENKLADELKIENKTESNADSMSTATDTTLDSKTEVTTAANLDKNYQQTNDHTENKADQNTEHPEKLIEEQVKEIEAKVERDLEDRISKELEAKIEKELQTKFEQEISKAIEKELNKAQNKEIDKDLKKDESPKEEADKGADKVSEKDSEKKEDTVVLAA